MQFTIEVLPAPLGPIIENSSPSFTPKLTSVSARTPPKRSDTPRTSKACSTHSLRWRTFAVSIGICAVHPMAFYTLWFLAAAAVQRAELIPARPVTIFNYGGQVRVILALARHSCIVRAQVRCKREASQPFPAAELV